MKRRLKGLRGQLYLWVALAGLLKAGTGAPTQTVDVSFSLQEPRLTLHEPVFINLLMRNGLQETVTFDLGFDAKEGFRFAVTPPGGVPIRLPPYSRGGIGIGGKRTLEPGSSYTQRILFNELYQITKPGEYSITVRLEAPIRTPSGRDIAPPPPEMLRLLVSNRDAKRLADVCQRMANNASGGDIEAAHEAAFGLSYVQDPVAVPYLGGVLRKGDFGAKSFAIRGLARIGTPEAVQVLTLNLNPADPLLNVQIEQTIREIKTGVKTQILD